MDLIEPGLLDEDYLYFYEHPEVRDWLRTAGSASISELAGDGSQFRLGSARMLIAATA